MSLHPQSEDFHRTGWVRFPVDPKVTDWVKYAYPEAVEAVADPANQEWLQCEGTWFVGVNALKNDPDGLVGASGPISGQAVAFLDAQGLAHDNLDRAQVSVMYPGYPRPRMGEAGGAFQYRVKRDAAHVDGLLPVGPDKRRFLREPHAFVLGLPLTPTQGRASPFVVWEGSHEIMRACFQEVLRDVPDEDWAQVDLTFHLMDLSHRLLAGPL